MLSTRPEPAVMKNAMLALATAALSLALASCGLEAERPYIQLQNDSDRIVVLQTRVDERPVPMMTVAPHTTLKSMNSPLKGRCVSDWEIVDTDGKLLKKIDRVCSYDTVVYS